jgi:hypothetical protein
MSAMNHDQLIGLFANLAEMSYQIADAMLEARAK